MTPSLLVSENQWKVQACKREPQILFHIFTWNIFVIQARAFFWDSSIRLCLITWRHYRPLKGMSNIALVIWIIWLGQESWKMFKLAIQFITEIRMVPHSNIISVVEYEFNFMRESIPNFSVSKRNYICYHTK